MDVHEHIFSFSQSRGKVMESSTGQGLFPEAALICSGPCQEPGICICKPEVFLGRAFSHRLKEGHSCCPPSGCVFWGGCCCGGGTLRAEVPEHLGGTRNRLGSRGKVEQFSGQFCLREIASCEKLSGQNRNRAKSWGTGVPHFCVTVGKNGSIVRKTPP